MKKNEYTYAPRDSRHRIGWIGIVARLGMDGSDGHSDTVPTHSAQSWTTTTGGKYRREIQGGNNQISGNTDYARRST